MSEELEKLKDDFKNYYSSEYTTDEEDTLENTRLRENAVSILANALNSGNAELAEQVLCTLSENTGSSEDLAIFEELIKPLIASGLITNAQVDIVVNAKAVTRWK